MSVLAMRKFTELASAVGRVHWLLVLLGTACRTEEPPRDVKKPAPVPPVVVGKALPVERIAIVGASVSAGFGGMPFGEAFEQAAPRSQIEAAANVLLFQDPIAESRVQIDRAIAFRATARSPRASPSSSARAPAGRGSSSATSRT